MAPIPRCQAQPLPQFRDLGIEQHLGGRLPLDLIFRDEQGKDVALSRYFDQQHPVVLILVQYRCPRLCNLILNDTLRSLRAIPLSIGDEFSVITVSFDPRESSQLAAEKKRAYVASYQRSGAERGWHFLTGEQPSIDKLASAVGFKYRFDAKSNQYIHPAGIVVVAPDGRISRYFYGLEYPAKDLRLSLVEASNGKIGTLADQILMFCYHYDPSTGRYSLAVLNAVRAAAVLLLIGVGIFLFLMFRRERRLIASA